MKTYLVKEIFGPTLQGEGSYTGMAVKFLRFGGCNRWSGRSLDKKKAICWFCDTDFLGGTKQTCTEILATLNGLGPCKNLVISGGEPALQLDLSLLCALREEGYLLHLETNGSIALGSHKPWFVHISMSPKQKREATFLESCDDLKLLYPSPIPGVTPEAFCTFPAKTFYIQPLDDENRKDHLARSIHFCLNNPAWRLSLQTHKMLGLP